MTVPLFSLFFSPYLGHFHQSNVKKHLFFDDQNVFFIHSIIHFFSSFTYKNCKIMSEWEVSRLLWIFENHFSFGSILMYIRYSYLDIIISNKVFRKNERYALDFWLSDIILININIISTRMQQMMDTNCIHIIVCLPVDKQQAPNAFILTDHECLGFDRSYTIKSLNHITKSAYLLQLQ